MEQTKNEPKNKNKAAPDNGKPKKERKPLTEAQRLKRQKMIVLPAMVLVFLGAMWLIFAPSSGKEQEPGTGGYNIEMPDADKANHRIIGDKAKAYEHEKNREFQKSYDVLNIAYHRAEGSRKIISRLCTLALKTGNVDEAIDYYDDFVQIAPKDPNQVSV